MEIPPYNIKKPQRGATKRPGTESRGQPGGRRHSKSQRIQPTGGKRKGKGQMERDKKSTG